MPIKHRIVLFILTLFISLFLIISCSKADGGSGGDNGGNDDNQANVQDGGGTDAENSTEAPFPEPNVPEKDYGGISFNVLYPNWGMFGDNDYLFTEEMNGDAMNDAIYTRNKKIEEQLNIKFNPIKIAGTDEIKQILPAVKKSVMAGDGSYDLAFIHPMCDLNTFAADGLLRNWNKIAVVDFSKPYWNQNMNDTLAINNILLFASSDFIIPDPSVVLFNKGILRDYNLENPYELVKNGTWTWDKFSSMAKQVSKDLNGDGIYDKEDLYGLAALMDGSGIISIMHSCNQYIAKKGADDVPELDIMSEKLISIIDMFYDLVYEGNQTYFWTYANYNWDDRELERFFAKNQALFVFSSPSGAAAELRAMEVDFGILPYPKYNEAQEEYISLNHAGLMCIPMDVKEPEMVGIVTELMAAESRRYTIPAYFDILLKYKTKRDDESEEMLNTIYNNTVYDFGYNYNGFTNVSYIVPRLIAQKSKDVASFYEANAPWTIKNMDKVYEDIMKYEDLDY